MTNKNADDALVVTVSSSFLELSGRSVGDHMELDILGNKIRDQNAARPRYKVADLLAEMPDGLPRVEGWEAMQSVGLER